MFHNKYVITKHFENIKIMVDKKIGIIGLGVVGNAIRDSFELHQVKTLTLDIDPVKTNTTYKEIKSCDCIFVCVPSPMGSHGECDSQVFEEVLENLKDFKNVIISKVTATPNIYKRLNEQYTNLVYIPEFLTSADPFNDYVQANKFFVGGSDFVFKVKAQEILCITHPDALYIDSTIEDASLAKYAINSFLATKVVFMNEIKELADKTGTDWNNLKTLIGFDSRIGKSHMNVPGVDGYGFGGMCFPKDTRAILHYAAEVDSNLNVLQEVVRKNDLLRSKK